MALTLDTIVNKVFTVVQNGSGYNRNEVDDFLDEILEEMENREAETAELKKQIGTLQDELRAAEAKASAVASAPAAPVMPAEDSRYSTESFELVLTKAKGAYEEILRDADSRAAEIVKKANEDAVEIRTNAQKEITDLSDRLANLKRQTSDYYNQVKRALDRQNQSMDDLKNLL